MEIVAVSLRLGKGLARCRVDDRVGVGRATAGDINSCQHRSSSRKKRRGRGMSTHFTTEIGRMRNDEMLVRAERYRRAVGVARHDDVRPARPRPERERAGLLSFVRRLAFP
jgi:hypothetical protein